MTAACWDDLSPVLHGHVDAQFGVVSSVEPAACGIGSELAVSLRTEMGKVFLKGMRLDHARADVRRIEARVQEHLPALAPRLLWHAEAEGWLLLAFEYVDGWHGDLTPDSADLPRIATALAELSEVVRPDLPVAPIHKRWTSFADAASLTALRGETLVHADLTADNIIVGNRVRFVDWAWPTLGAAWLDTAFMVARLIQAGHTPEQAEAWADQIPAWRTATREAIAVFIAARTGLARARAHDSLLRALNTWKVAADIRRT